MTVDQNQVAARFRWIVDKHGTLTPELVVQDAKNRKSPLHTMGGFEWDMEKAAEQHWLDHARKLIRDIRVEIKSETRTWESYGYVRDPRVSAEEQGYVEVATIRDDADLSRESLRLEVDRAMGHVRRVLLLARSYGLTTDAWAMLDNEMNYMRFGKEPPDQPEQGTQPSI